MVAGLGVPVPVCAPVVAYALDAAMRPGGDEAGAKQVTPAAGR
jgi:hypothetical protein